MKTRKLSTSERIRLLQNEIQLRKMFPARDAETRKENEAWLKRAEKEVREFYAPASLS